MLPRFVPSVEALLELHFRTLPDADDSRDKAFDPGAVALPTSIDLTRFCGPVYDQQKTHACSAHAVSSAITWLANQAREPLPLPSRLFIYYNARRFLDEEAIDAGATMRDAIKSVAKNGTCPESDWPYDIAQITTEPPRNCYRDATVHALLYQRIKRDLAHLKSCLAQGFPFIFAIQAYAQPFTAAATNGGNLPMPVASDQLCGGHAMMAVGYSDSAIKALNSLGSSYGDSGYVHVPFAYFTQEAPELTYDFWTIRKIGPE